MKKYILFLLIFLIGFTFAQNNFNDSKLNELIQDQSWDKAILDQENKNLDKQVKIVNEQFRLSKFETEKDFEKFIFDKFAKAIFNYCKNNYYGPIYRLNAEPMVKGDIMSLSKTEEVSEIIYGKTNIQKQGIDEPEILKTDKDYIIYVNSSKRKIYILKSPINGAKIDLNQVKILDKINIPKSIFPNSVKLFFKDNILIVIGTRYSYSFGQQVTDVVFYKINNGKAKFIRLFDTKGYFKDARLLDNKLYLVSSYNFPIWKICNEIFPIKPIRPLNKKEGINDSLDSISEKELNNKIKKYFKIKSIDIVYTPGKKTKIGNKVYPLTIKVNKSSLKNILYLPSNLTGNYLNNFSFNVINILDIKSVSKSSEQYVIFGNIGNGTMHMTKNSLYLVNTYYRPFFWKYSTNVKCKCILPIFPRGRFTLIHKLDLQGNNLKYVDSQIVPGRPINQYSMDENTKGYFRIFTKSFYPDRKTDLFIFDNKLNLVGKLLNIAVGEEFKSSRFIQDKAFLVTFKATDPLFAIDLKDPKNPKIVGELKIPGYSLYLHPYAVYDNVYYLIGIGQEAEIVNENWARPKNIKIDLYEIDFNKKIKNLNCQQYDFQNCPDGCVKNPCGSACEEGEICIQVCVPKCENPEEKTNYIKVTQLYSLTLGKEQKGGWGGSYTPVFDNPRSFSIYTFSNDKNKKVIFLSVYLAEDKEEENCYINYKWENGKRIKIGEKCYTRTKKEPYFIGIKGILIDKDKGLKEVYSKNNIDLYLSKCGTAYNCALRWSLFDGLNPRVSYYVQNDNLYPFEINGLYFYISDFGKILEKIIKF